MDPDERNLLYSLWVAGIYELVQFDEDPDKSLFTNIRLGLIKLKGAVGPWQVYVPFWVPFLLQMKAWNLHLSMLITQWK